MAEKLLERQRRIKRSPELNCTCNVQQAAFGNGEKSDTYLKEMELSNFLKVTKCHFETRKLLLPFS